MFVSACRLRLLCCIGRKRWRATLMDVRLATCRCTKQPEGALCYFNTPITECLTLCNESCYFNTLNLECLSLCFKTLCLILKGPQPAMHKRSSAAAIMQDAPCTAMPATIHQIISKQRCLLHTLPYTGVQKLTHCHFHVAKHFVL